MPSRHSDIARRNPWKDPLVVAFFISAAIHLLAFGLTLVSPAFNTLLGKQLKLSEQEIEELRIARIKALQDEQEPPLLFVNVDPAVATEEEPEEAKFYSDKSSKAADSQENQEQDIPRIDGTQTQVVKAEDTPRPEAVPLQPDLPPRPEPKPEPEPKPTPEPEPEERVNAEAEEQQKPGDLAMAKPTTRPEEEAPRIGRDRPRTLAQARLEKGLVGEKMKLDGGARRESLAASFNVKGTPFGVYDRAVVEAIQNHWYNLLDTRDFARERSGKVVLEFFLHYDGRITDLRIVESTVGEPGLLAYLCQKAVEEPSPYAPWPSDMRRLARADYRHVRFTFYYN